ncbi:MAG: hypothetical protein D4R43_00680 [Sphingobacteriales bacterium]|nr:MAG: hypothetical protein D4R43_00680 [Sphingobacteriales bacterium]
MKSVYTFFILLFFILTCSHAQIVVPVSERNYNFYSFTPEIKANTTELEKFSNEIFHPEYGLLPYNAGCSNCVEILEKRKSDERYFLKDSTNGTEFTIQKSYLPMHYKDAEGKWITIDPRIKKICDKKFAASQQQFPVEIDLENGFTSIVGKKKIVFNQEVKMLEMNGDVQLNELPSSNEVFFTAGDDGVEQRNFFPGIYRQLIVDRGSIETNYILIHKPLLTDQSNWLMFEDNFSLPDNYSIKISEEGYTNSYGLWIGDLLVINDKGLEEFRINKPAMFDFISSNDEDESTAKIGYKIFNENGKWKVQLFVSTKWLCNKERDYPVTIDPTVTISGSYLPNVYEGSGYANGTWLNTSCSYPINILFPGNATATNAGFSARYSAPGAAACSNCWIENGGMNIVGPCGISQEAPGLPWTCQNAPFPGTCTGSSIAIPQIINCVTPSCNPTPVQISLQLMRLVCSGNGCLNTCIRLDPTFYSVTLSGITVQSSITSSIPGFNLCSGTTVTFNSNSQYGVPPYTYVWSPGGSTTASISVTPLVNSTYTLIVSDACGNTYSALRLVNILPSSTATFTTTSPICISQTASFNYTGNGIATTTYLWNFNDVGSGVNNTSALQNPTHVFSAPGFYNVSLTTTLGACVSPAFIQSVFVGPQPTSLFTITPPQCIGQPVTITYSGNASVNAIYNWNFGTGTIISGSGQGPYQVQWNSAGNFPVSLSVTLGTCTSSITNQNAQIFALPTASINVTSPVCENQNSLITYSGNGGGTATYNWDFDGGTIVSGSGGNPHQVNWSVAGNYTIQLTVTKNGCSINAPSQNVIVNPIPSSSFSINPSPTCVGSPSIITYTGSSGPGATYNWIFTGGTIISGSGQGPYQVQWNTQGVKSVKLTVIENGCTSPQTINLVTVTPPITSAFSITSPICQYQTSTITYTGNANANAVYHWNFYNGTIVSGSGQGPYQISWGSWGNHGISLYVFENGCTSDTTNQTVFVYAPTSSAFSVGTACVGANTLITYSGNAGVTGVFNWNFGSGTIVSGSGIGPYDILWNTPGTYSVTLNVTFNGCVSIPTTQQVTVIQSPTSSFTVVSPACASGGTTVNYTGNANVNAPYNWYFGGGSIISGGGAGPWIISYPNPGSYNITLIVQDFGCTSQQSLQTVLVNPIPSAPFSLAASVCEGVGTPISYTGTSAVNATYNWDFDGGIISSGSGQGPYQVYWNSPGIHTITLSVTEGGCTSPVVSHSINIIAAPVADFNTTSPICADKYSTVTFNGSAGTNAVFIWDFGLATVLSGAGIGPYLLSFPSFGFYPVTLTITDFGCTSTSIQNISVNEVQTSTFTVTPVVACVNSPVNVQYTGSGNNSGSYNWNFGGGTISNGSGQGPYNILYSDTGTYTISLAVTEALCTSDTQIISLYVNPIPIPDFTAAPVFACDELQTFYFNNSTGAANYNWNFGDGTSDTISNPNHYYSVGLFDVSLTAFNQFGCSAALTIPHFINVQPTPSVQFTSDPAAGLELALDENEFVFENLTQNGTSYLWTFGDGDSSGLTNPVHVYGDTGNFFVTLIAYNDVGCSDSIRQGPYIIVPGAFIFIPNAFTPNNDGRNDVFRIFGHTISETSLQIFNRWGEMIYNGDGYKDGWDGTYQGKPLNTGVYIYRAFITKNSGLSVTLQGDLTLLR